MARSKKRLWGFDDGEREILVTATAEIPELRAVIARAGRRAELGNLWVVEASVAEHDAVSELTLTVLAAVAECERAVIVERTLDGIAAARRAGKKLGRPIGDRAPTPERVAALRAAGRSWSAIARRLGCTIGSARRAFDRGLPKPGAKKRGRRSVERGAA